MAASVRGVLAADEAGGSGEVGEARARLRGNCEVGGVRRGREDDDARLHEPNEQKAGGEGSGRRESQNSEKRRGEALSTEPIRRRRTAGVHGRLIAMQAGSAFARTRSPSVFLICFSISFTRLQPQHKTHRIRTNVVKHCPSGTDALVKRGTTTQLSAERSTRGGSREPRTPVRSP